MSSILFVINELNENFKKHMLLQEVDDDFIANELITTVEELNDVNKKLGEDANYKRNMVFILIIIKKLI
jgi:hypothetical protein